MTVERRKSEGGSWGAMDLSEGRCVRRDVGSLSVWIQARGDEWVIASGYNQPLGEATFPEEVDCGPSGEDRRDITFTRVVTVADDSIAFSPALPDRPVVLRPRLPIVILPGRWGRFYFSVPLWADVVSRPETESVTMMEIPTQNLSSTWFGDMDTGELCYSIDSRLLRNIGETDASEAYARCEIEIRNGSQERLQFQRLCVHVEHMHLYTAADRYWSNPVRVIFKGAEQVSQVTYVPGPPPSVPGARVVCVPRQVLDTNIFRRSFNLIREIAGI